jgi:flagellin FlaB
MSQVVEEGNILMEIVTKSVDRQRGITGLETAIILIAFVVVASVFAFTVLSTGIFASERSKETVYAGIQEAQASIEPRGSIVAYKATLPDSTSTVYKVTFTVSNAIAGQPVDLTPDYSSDNSGTDPDVSSGAESVTVISYSDKNQHLSDVPWSITWLGNNDSDDLLEDNEKAEITVWLLSRNNAVSSINSASSTVYSAFGGMASGATVMGSNTEFTIEMKPPTGAVLNLQRTLPAQLDTVIDLN